MRQNSTRCCLHDSSFTSSAFLHALMTDPLRETELCASGVPFLLALAPRASRASGVPFLLTLPRRVFERISFRRSAILLSALGYTSRNRLSSLPNLDHDKSLDSVFTTEKVRTYRSYSSNITCR